MHGRTLLWISGFLGFAAVSACPSLGPREAGIVSRSDEAIKRADPVDERYFQQAEEPEGEAPSAPPLTAEEFKKLLEATDRSDAAALVALGQRAAASTEAPTSLGFNTSTDIMVQMSAMAFRAALRANPDNPIARASLGFVKFGGEWTTEAAVKEERGLILVDGRWIRLDAAPAPLIAKPAIVAKAPEKKSDDPNAWYDDHTQVTPWEDAAITKTKRYLIRSNIKPEYVQRYGTMLDRFFKRFEQVFRGVITPGTRYKPSVVTIYPDQKTFMAKERVPKNVGGFYRPSDRIVVGYHGRFGKTGTSRTVYVHEGTHQFQHLVLNNGFANCPIWLTEGLAVLFEAAEWDPKRRKVTIGKIPRDRLEAMKRAVKEKKTLTLETLFKTPKGRFGGFHYAHAWAVIYRLVYGTKDSKARKRNARILSELFTQGRQRRVRYRDVLKAFGGAAGMAQFEEEWKAWIAKVPYDFKP